MKRMTLKNLLALLATLSCVFGAAAVSGCANGGANNSSNVSSVITLVDFKDETVDVAYGKTYTLQLMAKDDKGNMQSLKATVTTKDGKPVDVLNGKFVVLDKGGYVIEYKFENGGKTTTRKVTLNVIALAKPVIEVDGQTSAVISGRNYIIPTCTAIDYYDGELTPTVEIYKKSTDGNDVKVEYDAEYGVYTTSEAGEYYVLYSATNSSQKQGEKRLTFYVRESADAGEWDSFDDIGCEYSISRYDSLKNLTYLDTFEGREGVVCMAMSDANYGTFWGVEPKSFNVEDYENYKYIAISAYLAGEASDLLNVRFMTDCLITDVKANEWKTYYFDAASWIKRISAGTIAEESLKCVGSVFGGGDTKMYLDSIYFVNEVELDGCTFEQTDDGVKPVFEDTGALPDSYKVTFNGRVLPVYNGFFKADYVGDYVIEPVYTNSDKISFDTFTYTESGDTLKLNAYDKEIGASATTYVEPDVTAVDGNGAEVEGYSITKKVVYLDTVGVERTVLTVNPAKKGWYTYTFTAKADGKKSLETSAIVKVGDFIDGEILNVSDADAPKRFSSMFTGGTFETFTSTTENNETEGLPASYVGKTFIKLAYDTQYAYTTNNSYINFNSIMTKQEINDSVDNKVGFKLYVKAQAMDGVETMPNVTFDFLGEKTTLKLNAENTMHCSYATLLARYNKLSIHTTWADYVMAISTEIRKFAELTFYFDNIVTYEETDLPYAVRVTQENKSIIYNSDIPGVFVASDSDELSSFTGGYTGNAIKMYVATNPNYKFKNVYKPSQLQAIAKNYNTVSLWFAVDGITGNGSLYCWAEQKAFITNAAGGGNYALRKADNKVWKKYSISLDIYISILEQNNYEYIQIARTGVDGAITDGNAKAYFYVGDVEFSYVKPDILKVSETNVGNVFMDTTKATFVAAGADEIKDFAGGYTGNAAKLKRWTNNWYRFNNPYSLEQLAQIKQKYTKVSLWLAMDKLTAGSVRIYDINGNGATPDTFLNKAGWAGWSNKFFVANPTASNHLASATWHKVTISIDDYISLVTGADGKATSYCALMSIGQWESAGGENFYIGDITFEE